MRSAVEAATEVARQFGIISPHPLLLQETNNTVVWLRPEPVVAKVAVRARSQLDLRLEYAVATELAAHDAEIARPIPATLPVTHAGTGFVVTFWERLEGPDRTDVPASQLAGSLRSLHAALDQTEVALPPFSAMLVKAREVLDNDAVMAALPLEDRTFLRDVYDQGLPRSKVSASTGAGCMASLTMGTESRRARGCAGSTSRAAALVPSNGILLFSPARLSDISPRLTEVFSPCSRH